ADDVQDAAEHLAPDRHQDRLPGVLDRHAAHQTVGRVHRDRAHDALAEVLRDLDGQVVGLVADGRVRDLERRADLGKLAAPQGHGGDGADPRRAFPLLLLGHGHPLSAWAPPMISSSSLVMAACRARLYCSVYLPIISAAFLVALSIAVICAPKNDAIDSRAAR